jgi:enoyl-CoA hydratase/carnithine racemase
MAGTFSIELTDAVALVSFNRPPMNLMSMAAMTELEGVLKQISIDPDIHAVVVTGAVPGYFVAHADLDDLARLGRGERVEGSPASWPRVCRLLEEMRQPVIAAVNGQAIGGGTEIALCCMIRIAAEAATFGLPEVTVGIIPGSGGTQRLPRLIGVGMAARMILTGEVIDARTALERRLVEVVVPDGELMDTAMAMAARIASMPAYAVAAAKRAMIDGLRLPFDQGLKLEAEMYGLVQRRPDTVELQLAAARREKAPD